VARWNPQLFIDGHGMGAHDTHLFSPPRAPINPNIPKERAAWGALFARDQARAFDREKLVYYTGEWHEEWYPGYSDAWASYRGAVGILYEQARVAEDGVRRAGGRILSYRESLRHHVIGAMANLATLQSNRQAMLEYFLGTRKSATAPDGPYANRTFAILPTANQSRLGDLVDLLRLQGIEVYQAGRAFTATAATDQLGRLVAETNLAAGTILIPNRQPLGRLVAGMLEFDPRLPRDVLEEERQELLRTGKSRIYDITAWNLSMVYGLDALTLSQEMPADAKPWAASSSSGANGLPAAKEVVAYIIDGTDDRSVAAAARLMERNVEVCVAEKPFRFEGKDFVRGSVLVTVLDNRGFQGDLQGTIQQTAEGLGLSAVGIRTGLGDGDLPDLGGRHFQRLEPPKIAMFSRGGFSPYDFGSIWFVLDKHLAVRHSHLDEERSPELARYNVVVLPDRGKDRLPDGMVTALKDWVKAGGTLIAIGGSASNLTSEKAAFSKVRLLPDVLDKLPDYELAVLREWQARNRALPTETDLWAHTVSPRLPLPWPPGSAKPPEEKELKKRDAWQKLFMPEGTLLACRVDTNHWLTAGCGSLLPVLVGNDPILMAAEGVETAIRYGYLTAADTNRIANAAAKTEGGKSAEAGKPDAKDPPRIGWCALPEGTDLQLRMSGLLWPEAAHRLANAAYVTRESLGRGQIILFATSPTFRASARGTMRVFLNALICGPGLGAAPTIEP
jgi:hypothetical protein